MIFLKFYKFGAKHLSAVDAQLVKIEPICYGVSGKITAIYHPHRIEFVDQCIRAYRNRQLEQVLMFENIAAVTDTLKANKAILITHDAIPTHKQYIFTDFFRQLVMFFLITK